MSIFWLLRAMLLVQIALGGLGLIRWDRDRTGERREFDQSVLPAATLPLTPEGGAAIARALAAQWSTRAEQVAVSMRLRWDENDDAGATTLPENGYLIYVFAGNGRTLSIYLDRRTGLYLTSEETAHGGGDWTALDLTTYPKSSTIATVTANLIAGSEYRAACPAIRTAANVSASFVLSENGSRNPVWTITYGDKRHSGSFDVLVRVDAVSGNVIESSTRDRECG